MRKLTLTTDICAVVAILAAACHDIEEYDTDQAGNFDALWRQIDEHYCFFEEKGIDWDEVYHRYRPLVTDQTTGMELFDICSDMLDELRDGHVNLTSAFETSYYRKWWSDYPQNYNERLIQESYFHFDYKQVGGMTYGVLADSTVGYIRYPSFSYPVSDSSLDMILLQMANCKSLVIDIRDNGGGDLTNVGKLVSRFIEKRILAGSISHKTGPGHGDFSKPYEYYYDPADGHVIWLRPVAVLTNRSTFSAANNFAAIMKTLPMIDIVGATTGGGCGMPYSSEMPCGWSIRMSGSKIYDPEGRLTENGVEPSSGCAVDLDPAAAARGKDTMLERAITVSLSYYNQQHDSTTHTPR